MKRTATIALALLVSLLCAIVLFAFIGRAAVAVPFADELKFGALYAELAKGGVPALSTLMASHNGHPYLLLNLLLALTLHFGWSWSWMMYAQVPVLVLAFWVVLRNLADSTGGGAWPFVAAVGIACSLVTVRLWENLYWGMQISAALCFLFTVLCFDAAARYLRGGSGRAAGFTAAWGLLAVLSTGAGIFAALIAAAFVAVAALRAGRSRHAWLMGGYAAIALVLFLSANLISGKYGVGYQAFPWVAGIEHLLRMFAHAFFGMDPQRNGGLVLGAAVLVVASVLLAIALRRLLKGEDYAFECMVMLLGFALIGSITYARTKYGVFRWLYTSAYECRYEVVPGAFRLIAQFLDAPPAAEGWRAPLQAWNGPLLPRVNQGALFGLGNDYSAYANGFFAVVSVTAALAIAVWSTRKSASHDGWLCAALGLILAGTLGNLFDRVVFGGVRWMNGYSLQNRTLQDALGRDIPLGIWVAQQHTLSVLLSVGTIIFELGFVASLFLPRWRTAFFAAALCEAGGLILFALSRRSAKA